MAPAALIDQSFPDRTPSSRISYNSLAKICSASRSCIRCRTLDDMGRKSDVRAVQRAVEPLVSDSYGRLLWNPTTDQLEKIDTQWTDNRVTIARHGGVVGRELSDGLSA
jgi:hypothetical protein